VILEVPTPPAVPEDRLPDGFAVRLDPRVRRRDGGTALLGGSPLRLLRLRSRAQELLRADSLVVRDATSAALVARLLDAGVAHPDLATAAGTDGVTVVIPVKDRPAALARLLAALHADPATAGGRRPGPAAGRRGLAGRLRPRGRGRARAPRHDGGVAPAAQLLPSSMPGERGGRTDAPSGRSGSPWPGGSRTWPMERGSGREPCRRAIRRHCFRRVRNDRAPAGLVVLVRESQYCGSSQRRHRVTDHRTRDL
jgi:hypothetical protein